MRQIKTTPPVLQDSGINREPRLGVEAQQTLGTKQDRRVPTELQGSGD